MATKKAQQQQRPAAVATQPWRFQARDAWNAAKPNNLRHLTGHERKERQKRAVAMRIAGASWWEITRACGYSHPASALYSVRLAMESPKPYNGWVTDAERERLAAALRIMQGEAA